MLFLHAGSAVVALEKSSSFSRLIHYSTGMILPVKEMMTVTRDEVVSRIVAGIARFFAIPSTTIKRNLGNARRRGDQGQIVGKEEILLQ